jgi:hypothetical protein
VLKGLSRAAALLIVLAQASAASGQPAPQEQCAVPLPTPDPPLPADLFRALVAGDSVRRVWASVEILRSPGGHAPGVVHRAIEVAATLPRCHHLGPLAAIVEDGGLDVATRSAAATALGTIGRDAPCLFPDDTCPPSHAPLPAFAHEAVRRCLSSDRPVALRRSCAEAVGVAALPKGLAMLQPILDDKDDDPLVRFHAARSCTRIATVPCVTEAMRARVTEFATKTFGGP